jgi:hypothetical protein
MRVLRRLRQDLAPGLAQGLEAFHTGVHDCEAPMASRPISWVNTPVLVEAIERYERGLLPRSLQLWLQHLLEIDQPLKRPLRPHG